MSASTENLLAIAATLNHAFWRRTKMFNVTFTIGHTGAHKPTIYEALKTKLGREPTDAELRADVQRILSESHCERAEQGKLRHQRKR
jgi:predicted ATPase